MIDYWLDRLSVLPFCTIVLLLIALRTQHPAFLVALIAVNSIFAIAIVLDTIRRFSRIAEGQGKS